MDVQALKSLYSTNGNDSTSGPGNPASSHFPPIFSVEEYTLRVADDRALLERLIRLAQTHDLLRKNAERAEARAG